MRTLVLGRCKERIQGFTLLELLTVCLIIGILATLIIPVVAGLQAKVQRAHCVNNLKSLYVAANSYVQQQGHWPQIATRDLQGQGYAKAWVEALSPFGISEKNWICPTVERELSRRLATKPGQLRLDYFATPFDDNPRSPSKWPTQPWFVERGDVHGDGNLLVLTSGEILTLKQVATDSRFGGRQ